MATCYRLLPEPPQRPTRGSRHWLPPQRSLPCDILHFARQVPIVRAEMEMALGELARRREAAEPRVSWTVLFVKALAIVADHHPWLRQTYFRWPVPHVYQHPQSVAMVAVQREEQGRPRLCFGRFVDPVSQSLHHLQRRLDEYAQRPLAEVFSKQVLLSRWPWPLRRLALWTTLNVSGRVRERQVGTFTVSSLAGLGVNNRDHPTVCTSSLSYGPLDASGRALVTLLYDHRLADGRQAAQVLDELQSYLTGVLIHEITAPNRRSAAAA